MHRFSWDLRFDPVSPQDLIPAGDEEATGAVPGRTYPNYNVPWVPPGTYTARLTVNGTSQSQPIEVKLDPRVKIAPVALAQLNALSVEMYEGAVAAHRAFNEAKALGAKVAALTGADAESVKGELEALAPTGLNRMRIGGFRRRGAATATPTLEAVSNALQAAAMGMQGEVAPTDRRQYVTTGGPRPDEGQGVRRGTLRCTGSHPGCRPVLPHGADDRYPSVALGYLIARRTPVSAAAMVGAFFAHAFVHMGTL
jgi:hypothetical protein